jgi:hypothetical protein
VKDPSKPVRYAIILCLLALLLFLRIQERVTNEFWDDEIHLISNLLPLEHLLFEHLPDQPGSSAGHYLLTALIQYVMPNNKYALGFPGLIAHVIVFLLLSRLLLTMKLTKPGATFWPATVTGAGFAINATLAYQSMEVRAYSLLPLLWVLSVFLAHTTIRFLDSARSSNMGRSGWLRMAGILLAHAGICIWHIYGLIMLLSIYTFFAFTSWPLFLRAARRPLTIGLIITTSIMAIPVWLFFSGGSLVRSDDTFEHIPLTLSGMTSSILGNLAGRPDLSLGIITLIVALGGLTLSAYRGLRNRQGIVTDLWPQICLYVVLVAAPIGMILVTDIVTQYWFLQRQFIWTAVPFWMGIGVAANNLVSSLVCKVGPGRRTPAPV